MAVLQSGVLLFYGSAVQNNARRISTRARLTRWPYSIGASKSADVTFPFRQLIHKASKKAAWFFWLSSCNSGAAGGCAGHAKQHNKRDHPPELQAHGGCMTSAFKFHLIGHLESSIVCSALGYGGESQETREKTRAIDAEIGRSSLQLLSLIRPWPEYSMGTKTGNRELRAAEEHNLGLLQSPRKPQQRPKTNPLVS
jgi:hypothetical protein